MSANILISGAGIAGLTLAYWLKHYGFRPTIVERAPSLREGGYLLDFFGLGYDVAEKMNLRPQLEKLDLHLKEVAFVDENNRHKRSFDADGIRRALGGRFCNILRSGLARIIYEAVQNDVEIVFDDAIQGITQDGGRAHVDFVRGAPRDFDIVVGADGLHSNVRRLLFGEESRFEQYCGYYTSSFTIDNDVPHGWSMSSYTTPGKQVGVYPLGPNRLATFFLFASKERFQYDPRDTASQMAILRRTFARERGMCPLLLERMETTRDFYFDSVSVIHMDRWSDGNVVLLGDACCCPSLLSGQGTACAMAGAYVLAGELAAAGGNPRFAFGRYEKQMKVFIDDKQKFASRFARTILPNSHFGIWARDQMTRLMVLPFVTDWLMKTFWSDKLQLRDYEGFRYASIA